MAEIWNNVIADAIYSGGYNDGRFSAFIKPLAIFGELIDDYPKMTPMPERMHNEYDVGIAQCTAAVERIIDDSIENSWIEVKAE